MASRVPEDRHDAIHRWHDESVEDKSAGGEGADYDRAGRNGAEGGGATFHELRSVETCSLASSTNDSGIMTSSNTASPPSSLASSSSDVGHTSIVRSIAQKFEGTHTPTDEYQQHLQQHFRHQQQQQQQPPVRMTRSSIASTVSTSSSASNSRSASPSGKQRHLSRGTSSSAEVLFGALLQLFHINDFELSHLGSGFYGDVFKALHLETEEVMVLKKNKFKGNPKYVRNEIELLHAMRHKNILRHLGACVEGGTLHPLTEFIEGGDLETLLQRRSERLSWKVRMQLCADIASGMTYLHAKDFLHRDLTSKNCLIRRPKTNAVSGTTVGGGGRGTSGNKKQSDNHQLTSKQIDECQGVQLPGCLGQELSGKYDVDDHIEDDDEDDDDDAENRLQAVICDYGLATKIPDPKCKVVKRLSIKGHPYWMSPECMTGKDYNKSSDVFSFGVIICETLTRLDADPDVLLRTRDFGMDKENLLNRIDKTEGPPPDTLVELAMICCNLDPSVRPSFQQLKERLKVMIKDCNN